MVFDWGFRCFSDIEGIITNKSIYAFSFLVGKHREPQSIKAKLFLPIIPIGIVAYALTLLWDDLCRNSCISFEVVFMQRTTKKWTKVYNAREQPLFDSLKTCCFFDDSIAVAVVDCLNSRLAWVNRPLFSRAKFSLSLPSRRGGLFIQAV